jgi:excisionase family DNA binding protein
MDTIYMTPSEVARRLRVDDTTVRRWIHVGLVEAEAIQQGKRVRYRTKTSVVEAIERRDSAKHRVLV